MKALDDEREVVQQLLQRRNEVTLLIFSTLTTISTWVTSSTALT